MADNSELNPEALEYALQLAGSSHVGLLDVCEQLYKRI